MRTIGLKPEDRVLVIERRERNELVHNALVLSISMNERLAGPQGHGAIDAVMAMPAEWGTSDLMPRFVTMTEVHHISHSKWAEGMIGFAYEELPPQSGVCQFCGCTENRACVDWVQGEAVMCCWMDAERTVCSNPACLNKADDEGMRLLTMDLEVDTK